MLWAEISNKEREIIYNLEEGGIVMEKEWWKNAIKHLEDMSMEEFEELVEKAEKVNLSFQAENIVLPKTEGKSVSKHI